MTSAPNASNGQMTGGESMAGTVFILFIFLWMLFGFIAFIYSLFCFSRSGTTFDKFIGLLIAFFTGPFFFLYLRYNASYCK
jgi:hypothetical protein